MFRSDSRHSFGSPNFKFDFSLDAVQMATISKNRHHLEINIFE